MTTRLCSMSFSVSGFIQDPTHADQISDYLAHIVSLEQPDTFLYSNTLSAIINEIAETMQQSGRPDSQAVIEILTESGLVHIALHVDAADPIVSIYERASELAASEQNPWKHYKDALFSAELAPELGVLRLLASYKAKVSVARSGDARAAITVSAALDELVEVSS